MFFKSLAKGPFVFCTIGFVAGMFFSLIMPPVVIAIIEGILLILMCICILCR